MKVIFWVVAFFLCALPIKAQNVEFEKVVESSISKENLFSNAQKWGSMNDPVYKKNIEISNKEANSLVITIELGNKERTPSETKYLTYKFRFSVKIDCKDNKYRYVISSPSVLVGTDNTIRISNLSSKQLYEYKDELEAVARISENEFNKILDWGLEKIANLVELNNRNINQYKEHITKLEGDKKNKKEVQRIKYKLENIEANNLILNESLKRWDLVINELSTNIEKAMNVNDDF